MSEEKDLEQGIFTEEDLPEHPKYIKQISSLNAPKTKVDKKKQKQRMIHVRE